MANLGTAYVQIVPEATGISGKITRAINPEATAAGAVAGTSVARSLGSKLSSVGGSFIKAGAIATAVSVPIIAGIHKAMDAYMIQSAAETKLTEIYRTRMGVTQQAAQATIDYAAALQKQGVIGDEVLLSGAQQLATFAQYPGTINSLLPAMGNLLAQQKGVNATAQDATQIGNLMGKVLQGQTGALKRVGITFTEAQEQVLKYGTEEERAAMLAQVITDNVGNMNKVMAETPEGKIQQMKNAFGDMAEQIGATLAPVLADLANWISTNLMPKLQSLIEWFQGNPVAAKIIVAVAGILAVGGPLLILIGTLISSIGTIMGILPALAGPAGIVIGIIAAVIAIGVLLYQNWDTIKAKAGEIKDWIVEKWNALKEGVTNAVNALKEGVSNAWNAIKATASSVWNGIKSTITSIVNGIKSTVTSIWNGIKSATTSAWNAVKTAIQHPIETAKNLVQNAINAIKSILSGHLPFPKIKLPHFSISGHFSLSPPSIPHFSVSWYKEGGIMTQPTLFGGGEAGPEAILPLNTFWDKMDKIANNSGGDEITINVYATPGMDVNELAARVEQRLTMQQRQRNKAYGMA